MGAGPDAQARARGCRQDQAQAATRLALTPAGASGQAHQGSGQEGAPEEELRDDLQSAAVQVVRPLGDRPQPVLIAREKPRRRLRWALAKLLAPRSICRCGCGGGAAMAITKSKAS